jgi:N-formylglutamate deformylase
MLGPLFDRFDPPAGARAAPVLFEAPRSGTCYPADFRPAVAFDALHAAVSSYVPELYAGAPDAGIPLMVARVANSVVDLNRHPDDVDADMLDGTWLRPLPEDRRAPLGIGLIRRYAQPGQPIYTGKLAVAEVERRIATYHAPYHAALAAALERLRASHGWAMHVSLHCMSAVGNALARDHGAARPAFCIGDRHGTTCDGAVSRAIVDALAGCGYDVTLNAPYAGAYAIARHSAPERGIHSVQIEIRKDLFMDEASGARHSGFDRVRGDLDRLAKTVADFARDRAQLTVRAQG